MTFTITKLKDDQRQMMGTFWTQDEANAQMLATKLCGCAQGEQLQLCRTDDREIPLRLAAQTYWAQSA